MPPLTLPPALPSSNGRGKIARPLKPRQERVCFLYAAGYSQTEISAQVGYTPTTICLLLKREDARALVTEYKDKFLRQSFDDATQAVLADTGTNVRRIKELRDQDAERNVALGAAKLLLERQMPAKTQTEHRHLMHLVIDKAEAGRIQSILDEANEPDPLTLDATPTTHGPALAVPASTE